MSNEVISENNLENHPAVHEIFRRTRERKLGQAGIDISSTPELHDVPKHINHSIVTVLAQKMCEQDLLDLSEMNDLHNIWSTLAHYYQWHHLEQITPVLRQWTATMEMRWAASGLTAVDEEMEKLGAIPTDTLRNSIVSGAIKAIFRPNDEHMLHSMAKFLEILTGESTELGDYNRSIIDKEITDLTKRHQILKDSVHEAAHQPYNGKYYGGPYKRLFEPVIKEVSAMIHYIHPDLGADALHSHDYRDNHTQTIMRSLSEMDKEKIKSTARWRYDQCLEIMKSTWQNDKQQTLPFGLYDRPHTTKQDGIRSCAATAFRMVHQGITGYFVGEEELRQLIKEQHSHQFVTDEEYLKLFETETFKKEYGKRVQSLQFMGMNLETLRTIAERKRAQHENIRMFTVANLATESDSRNVAARIQHRVILYGADEKYVYLIDPNHPFRDHMDKREFCKRWAVTQNSGYLVISK